MGKKNRRKEPKAAAAASAAAAAASKAKPVNVRWESPAVTGTPPAARGGHTATAVANRLYIFGGADRTPATHDDMHVLELGPVVARSSAVSRSACWTEVARAAGGEWPAHRTDHTAIAAGSKIFVMGGQDPVHRATAGCDSPYLPFTTHVFDTESGSWSTPETTGSVPTPRASHSCVLSNDGTTLAVTAGSGDNGPQNDFFLLDTKTMAWSELLLAPNFAPVAREMHCCFCLESGWESEAGAEGEENGGSETSIIYIAGGRTADKVLDTMEPINLGGAVLLECEVVGEDEPDLQDVALGGGAEQEPEDEPEPEPEPEPELEGGAGAECLGAVPRKYSPAMKLPKPVCGQAMAVWDAGSPLPLLFGGTDMGSVFDTVWALHCLDSAQPVRSYCWLPVKVTSSGAAPVGRFAHTITALQSAAAGGDPAAIGEPAAAMEAAAAAGGNEAAAEDKESAAVMFGGVSFETDLNDVHILYRQPTAE